MPHHPPCISGGGERLHQSIRKETAGSAPRRGIPIISTFEQVLGVKTILMGFGLESNAIHSPNENIPLDILRKGIEAVVEFHLNY